ncbi:MAG: ester cyclase [Actinomycetota bacterium]|nr:ester cyclase [Actinomycetota bacterium]
MSEQERNKEDSKRFLEGVFNQHDLSVFDELIADDFTEHEVIPGFSPDKAGSRQWFEAMFQAFPDFRVDVDDMVADGDRVAIRSRFSGTHQGEFMGIPATGRPMSVGAMDIIRVVDRKATDHWGVFDTMGLLMQLGVIPTPEAQPAG